MPDAEFYIRQNDTASPITATLTDEAGAAIELTGATIKFQMAPIQGGAVKVSATATNLDTGPANRGQVSYQWTTGQTDTAGLYLGEWQVTFAGGAKQTFPNDGYTLVRVTGEVA